MISKETVYSNYFNYKMQNKGKSNNCNENKIINRLFSFITYDRIQLVNHFVTCLIDCNRNKPR